MWPYGALLTLFRRVLRGLLGKLITYARLRCRRSAILLKILNHAPSWNAAPRKPSSWGSLQPSLRGKQLHAFQLYDEPIFTTWSLWAILVYSFCPYDPAPPRSAIAWTSVGMTALHSVSSKYSRLKHLTHCRRLLV